MAAGVRGGPALCHTGAFSRLPRPICGPKTEMAVNINRLLHADIFAIACRIRMYLLNHWNYTPEILDRPIYAVWQTGNTVILHSHEGMHHAL